MINSNDGLIQTLQHIPSFKDLKTSLIIKSLKFIMGKDPNLWKCNIQAFPNSN